MLSNASYANVTGGQRVEAVRNGTNVTITSGLVSKSSVVTPVCFLFSEVCLDWCLLVVIEFKLHRWNGSYY